ncbi:MAG TPA: hypothetical protein VFK09_11505 [Gemmatimonadales bacterium]|nr:hypothetical protein [Gemmatimonadales bacterium]
MVAAVLPCLLAAQTVSPPVAEYQERARSSFQLSNGTIFPLTAVLEVHGFRVTERGEVVNAPLDTSQVHVKLSATSFRIPPRGTYTVFYEAAADSTPAWFLVTAALTGARTDNGLNVRIILPHVVYLNQKQALQKGDVVVRRLELDSAAGKARVELENTGPRLGRVQELSLASSGNAARATGGFPLFPHFHRWVELDWDLAEPPARVRVRLPKFAVDTAMVPAAAAGGTSPSTDARQQAGAPAPTPRP